MNSAELRALAQWHATAAINAAKAAENMGTCLVADEFSALSRQHCEWALGLNELADALDTFRPEAGVKELP